jgi:hypothetical protein
MTIHLHAWHHPSPGRRPSALTSPLCNRDPQHGHCSAVSSSNATSKRAITVMKTRASAHQPEIREFIISPDGIVLGDEIVLEHRFT